MKKSKDKKIEIREIVYSQDDEKSFGDIFVYEPENVEERNLGSLFIIGELKDLPRNSSYVVNLLASKIKKEFYSNTKRSAEDSLEAALSIANQTISELAEQGNGEYVSKLSMACGTYKENKFFLSQVGKIKSLLVRGGQIIEIIKEDENRPASVKRAFNNIASGELADGDLIIFATAGLFNIFSFDKLRQLASSLDLDEFAAKLQEEVEEEDSEVVSALLLEIEGGKKDPLGRIAANLENEEEEEEKEPLDKVVADTSSSEESEEAEEFEEKKTKEKSNSKELDKENPVETAVAAAGLAAIETTETPEAEKGATPEERLKEAKAKRATEENAPKMEIVEAENVNDRTVEISDESAGKISLSDIIKEYEKMENKSMEAKIAEKDRSIENIISKKENSDFEDLDEQPGQKSMHGAMAKIKGSLSGIGLGGLKSSVSKKFNKISSGEKEYMIKRAGSKSGLVSGKKALIAIAAIIIIAIIISPKLYKNDTAQENKKAAYQALLSESQGKLAQAEANSSGSDQDAGKLFFDAKALATRVRDEYDGLDSEADTVISKAQEELNKVDKVAKVGDVQTIASFDNNNISNFVDIAGTTYAIDGKENAVYKVDAAKNQLAQIAKASSKIGEIKFAQNFQNQEIILSDGSAASSFGLKSATIQKLDGTLDPAAKDMVVYGKNIYFLSPSASQIYKYQKTAQGLDGKSDWLKSGDVKNAVSMAIDQNIYALYSDGQVKKFFTGQEASDNGSTFSIKQPVDAIASATKIFTQNGQKNLYILEPGKSRILIYDKTTGALVKQLTGDGFSSIKDISVDAKETALTALTKGKIVKMNL